MSNNDNVVKLISKKEKEEAEKINNIKAEIQEFLGVFAAAVDAYNAMSFAAVAISEDGEPLLTYTSGNGDLLPLIGAVEGIKRDMLEAVINIIHEDDYEQE